MAKFPALVLMVYLGLGLSGAAQANTSNVQLLVSNEPEILNLPGRVQRFELKGFQKYRFLFHHQAVSGNVFELQLRVFNSNRQGVSLSVSAVTAGPSDDEIFSGQLLMQRYWQRQLQPSSNAVFVPAGFKRTLLRQVLRKNHVANGIVEIVPVGSEPLVLELQAQNPSGNIDLSAWDIFKENISRRTDGAIGDAELKQEFKMICGKPTLNMRLGDVPFVFNDRHLPYEGHYGIWHHIKIEIEGAAVTQQVQASFLPKGGIAAMVFKTADRIFSFPAQAPGQVSVAQPVALLLPGGNRILQMDWMPQPGSNYPIELLLSCRRPPGG